MSSSQIWHTRSIEASPAPVDWEIHAGSQPDRGGRRISRSWIILDALTVVGATIAATLYETHMGLIGAAKGLWHGTLIHGQSMGALLAMLLVFMAALIETSHRMHLYTPSRAGSLLNEQRLTFQACIISGLLLTGTLYMVHAAEVPRSIVMLSLGIVMVALSLRRLIHRLRMYSRYRRGVNTRNVLIVGTGAEAHALRRKLIGDPASRLLVQGIHTPAGKRQVVRKRYAGRSGHSRLAL